MIEREPTGFDQTIAFISEASVVPLDKKPPKPGDFYPPKNPRLSDQQYNRMFEITGRYLLADEILKEVGRSKGLSRERIRQLVQAGVLSLRLTADKDLKKRYLLQTFGFGKPLTLAYRRQRYPVIWNLAAKAKDLVTEGKSAEEIRQALGITVSQLASVRVRLRPLRVELPYLYETCSSQYRSNLERLRSATLTFKERKEILNSLTKSIARTHSQKDNPLIYSIERLAQEAGLFVSSKDVARLTKILDQHQVATALKEWYLKENPGRRQKVFRYYYIASCDKQRAVEIFKTDPDLATLRINPVQVLGQESDRLPTVFQLYFSGSYRSVGVLIAQIELRRLYSRPRLIRHLIGPDCPVSVFVHQPRGRKSSPSYYYKASQEDLLRSYFFTAARTSQGSKSQLIH